MGKKSGSVAPKERVNITYKPATGDQAEEVELPLRILMMGDYGHPTDDTPLEERKTIQVDKDNFDKVFAGQELSLDFTVKDELSGDDGSERAVHLDLRSMRDFSPDRIAEQVPELRQLLELRKALIALKHPLADKAAFRKRIQKILDDPAGRAQLLKELGMAEAAE